MLLVARPLLRCECSMRQGERQCRVFRPSTNQIGSSRSMAMTSCGSQGQTDFAPFFNPSCDVASGSGHGSRDMHLDVMESEHSFEIRADLPGMNKSDIKVHVDHDVVTVSVEKENQRNENKEDRGVRYHRMERSSQFVRRTVRMPETANLDQIKAKYDNGVLQLNIPKKEDDRLKQQVPVQ